MIGHEWAARGQIWDIGTPGVGGVSLYRAAVRGLGMPDSDDWVTAAPMLHGQRFRGFRIKPREIFWPILVYGARDQEWIDRDGAFWQTMRPDVTGVWTVTAPDASRRSITCRFSGVTDGYDRDPSAAGVVAYGVTLVADDPFWRGPTVSAGPWSAPNAQPFFGGAVGGSGPLLYVSARSGSGGATVNNPGDVEAWPVWTITGPATSATVAVGGAPVGMPFALAAGEVLTIDTDPTVLAATSSLSGDKTRALSAATVFAPIPAGANRGLSAAISGTGSVRVSFTPRYYRAW